MAEIINLATQPPERLRCLGVGRDAENPQALVVCLNRPVSDDEMRYLHDVLRRAATCSPVNRKCAENGHA